MELDQMPLAQQVEMVFAKLEKEVKHLSSGAVFLQIRNNVVGKFGVKHEPVESRGGVIIKEEEPGMTDEQYTHFRKIAIDSLRHKHNWTHGEIVYDFAIRQSKLHASTMFESNYNMANLLARLGYKP